MGIKASRSKRSTVRTETTAQPQRHDRAHLGLPRSRELVWLITGPSSVFARRLIDSLVAQGDKIVAVGWNTDKLQDLPQNDQVKVMQLDLAEGLPILELKIAEAVGLFGRIDVLLLQHGGISVQAIAREGSTSDRVKKKHSTHVHGVLDLTNAVLPHMRMQQSGTIVLIGSRSSWRKKFATVAHYASCCNSHQKDVVRRISPHLAVDPRGRPRRLGVPQPGRSVKRSS